ncbi:MAG: PAS domain S-box protein [Leptolyngbya sp.]|nr:PAS domain S-box protein [Candidatus Melainabacteria bacterium]
MKQADSVREQTEAIEAESPLRQAENRENMKRLLVFGLAVTVLLAVALALSFNRVLSKRLAIVVDNTRRLASSKPLNPPLEGNDEIAELDKVFASMASAMSVSQLKERALLKNAVDVICSIDGGGTISEVSPACGKVWGYSEDELFARRLLSIVAEEDIEFTKNQIETLKNDENTHTFENRIKRKDGSLVDMLWSISWVDSEKSYFCVAHDNTDRKNAERMKRDFVSMLSHDLRSPLNSIQAFFWMVREKVYGELSEKGMQKAKGLESTTTWLIEMISDLLDIDRFEAGLFNLEISDVSLKSLVEKANDALGALADNDNIKVILPTNDIIVNIDGDLFMRVITNLLSNAIKFSPPNSQVEVVIENRHNLVELRIIDHGSGISEEDQKTVFDRFKQVKGTGIKNKRGSGLGLAVSKAIVDQHRGTIGVTSVPGEGSTFWVRLPAS